MQRKQRAAHYRAVMISELFIILVAIYGTWEQLTFVKKPLETWAFWATIVVGMFAFAASLWALMAYVRARKHEQLS
ncbi:hypothetical protein [Dictyobacter formicarum]|uniref:Uncharacterized protein n=1 Tax=Dictyobacter formicarum TaxID=2778368 RepID=A0ABQ3VB42_9CHLR|nr:hypothetical protein [Dictyobacter formicarum]GHO83249.1 hypothetical protein KSZ_12550 [Dictyobacter formicarum]